MSAVAALKKLLRVTPGYGLFQQLRSAHRLRKAASEFWAQDREDAPRMDFYRQFVQPGAVVFDVGANLGNRARVFWKLGAEVIGVEPQPMCAGFLRTVFAGKPRFTLVEAALGAQPGHAEMMVSNAHTISSLSPEWVQTVRESGRFPDCSWNQKRTVVLETLDRLIVRHGRPAFVKIDVEGFEDQVLAGLSQQLPALSIEYTPEFEQGARRCVEHLVRLGEVRFQVSLGESMQWDLPEWVDGPSLLSALRRLPADVFGDIYARSAE